MRDLFTKIMTGSMVASAALLVAACGGSETAETNNTMTEMDTTDPMMDGTTNDVTAVDGAMGTDANMAMDSNMTMDSNMSGDNMSSSNMSTGDNSSSSNMTNGM